jgi:hypothetical protein
LKEAQDSGERADIREEINNYIDQA